MVAASENGEEDRFASVFVKQDALGNAVAGLVANNNDVKASITAIVDDKTSNIKIAADKVEFSNGDTVAAKIQDNITSIAALQADKASVASLNALTAKVNSLTGDTASMDSLHSYEGDGVLNGDWDSDIALDGQHVVIDDGKIEGYTKTGENKIGQYSLNADGSGFIADGNISWDEDGNVTINYKNVKITDQIILDIINLYSIGNIYYMSYRIMKNGFVLKDGFVSGVPSLTKYSHNIVELTPDEWTYTTTYDDTNEEVYGFSGGQYYAFD